MNKRRNLLMALAGAALAAPLVAIAQQPGKGWSCANVR